VECQLLHTWHHGIIALFSKLHMDAYSCDANYKHAMFQDIVGTLSINNCTTAPYKALQGIRVQKGSIMTRMYCYNALRHSTLLSHAQDHTFMICTALGDWPCIITSQSSVSSQHSCTAALLS
jgi:hypothetical protein